MLYRADIYTATEEEEFKTAERKYNAAIAGPG